jgi:hypothetical protein
MENLNELISLGSKMENFPEAQTLGELVIQNYNQIISEIDDIYKKFDELIFLKPKNQDEYFALFKGQKGIEEFQKNLKIFLKKLDNEKIEKLREKTNELIKLLGKKNGTTTGQLTFLIEEYKTNERMKIIETTFTNINSYENYPADFDFFTKKCNEALKGKSSFEEMQNVCLNVAENYNNKLTMDNMLFFQYKKELEDFCKKIKFLFDTDFLISEVKKIVQNLKKIEEVKESFKLKLDEQEKNLQKRIEFERNKERLKIELDQKLINKKPTIEEIKISEKNQPEITPQSKKITIFEFFITNEEKEKIKELLVKNGFHTFKIEE